MNENVHERIKLTPPKKKGEIRSQKLRNKNKE